jgi:glycosyltransferase involved in cell wall biosynthesis
MAEKLFEKVTLDTSTQPMCNVVAIIPAYNEDRFIGSVVLKVKEFVHQVIVVDDGSTDQTAKIAEAAGAIFVKHETNKGKGIALNTGLDKVRDLSPNAVVVLDADGQHNPAEIPLVISMVLECRNCERGDCWQNKFFGLESDYEHRFALDQISKADIVIGSRYLENNSRVPNHRILGHKVFNWITKFASGVKSTDSQSGFRAFSPKALSLLKFSSDSFSVESEMQVLAHENGLVVSEVPISVEYNERPKRNVIKHGLIVIGGLIRLIGQHRPLLFFGVPGVILMLAGLGMGAAVVSIYRQTEQLAVGYAMISVLLSVVGAVSFSTGIILHSVRLLINERINNF